MKILFDHQIFSIQRAGGISRYFSQLITGLAACEDIETETSLKYSNNYYVQDSLQPSPFFPHNSFIGKSTINSFVNRQFSRPTILKADYDVFHPTYYDDYFLRYLPSKSPFVITVYDLIHEKIPNLLKDSKHVIARKRKLVHRANALIAISDSTKNDILEYYEIEESKIHVIQLASSLPNLISGLSVVLPKRFILYVGQRESYKNFSLMFSAIASLLVNENISLLCVGGGGFKKEEKDQFSRHGVSEDKVIQLQLTDQELAYVYSKASLFIFPSLYEGFGIPLLEAMQMNCPIACSDTEVFKEVAGSAASFFSPSDKESIAEAVSYILGNDRRRNQLVKEGQRNREKFTWTNVINQTISVYESVIL